MITNIYVKFQSFLVKMFDEALELSESCGID